MDKKLFTLFEEEIFAEAKRIVPLVYDEKDLIKFNKLTTLDFLKMFERKKRLELVDILRGAKPIQIDFEELKVECDEKEKEQKVKKKC